MKLSKQANLIAVTLKCVGIIVFTQTANIAFSQSNSDHSPHSQRYESMSKTSEDDACDKAFSRGANSIGSEANNVCNAEFGRTNHRPGTSHSIEIGSPSKVSSGTREVWTDYGRVKNTVYTCTISYIFYCS